MPSLQEAPVAARVLVFTVDDGLFCVHLDWVEAVYQKGDLPLHSLKTQRGSRRFVIHHGQPAWVVDLREAFALDELLGLNERTALAVIRAGSALLAVPVDACVGVRDLDLAARIPVPSAVLRDGGIPVGHLVDIDGKLHGLLEPSRIPSSTLRDELDPLLKEALAFRDREAKLTQLSDELRRTPSLGALKNFGRLSRRNGRTKTATAVRSLQKVLENGYVMNGSLNGDLSADTLLRDVVALANAQATGELQLDLQGSAACIYFDAGRVADAKAAGEWGRGALKEILASRNGTYSFASRETGIRPQRIADATLWVLLECIEQLTEERRARHLR